MFGFLKKKTEENVDAMKEEISNLRLKLKQSQENINKTNAFWKKRVYDLQQKLKKS